MAVSLTNPSITKAWSLIATAAQNFLAGAAATGTNNPASPARNTNPLIEVAPMPTESAPSGVRGIPLSALAGEIASRSVIPEGAVYARLAPGQDIASATIVLITW